MLNIQITRIHCGAVCQAIGEQLSAELGPQTDELPPGLLALMEQFPKNLDVPRKFA